MSDVISGSLVQATTC